MHAEAGVMSPYFHSFSHEVQQLQEFCRSLRSNVPIENLVGTSTISEYDMGGEGDLFKAPEPIIEEPSMDLDPITAAISMITFGENVMSSQTLRVADIESTQTEQLLSDVFYDCRKDLLAKEAIEISLLDVLDIMIPVGGIDENLIAEDKCFREESFQKNVSLGCLSSEEHLIGAPTRPNFQDYPGMDLDAFCGIQRSFSEGNLKTLDDDNASLIHSPRVAPESSSNSSVEDRMVKLSRYRNKKTKRNFGRKIKYACRKALADSQPRIRGRFAKTEESDIAKKR